MFWIQFMAAVCLAMALTAAGDSLTPSIISPEESGICPLEEEREDARERIHQQTMSIIRDSILPNLCNPGGHPDFPATSCDDIPEDCSSGWYWLQTPSDETVRVYCDLERKCGCDNGNETQAWMRVAHLDMTDPEERCPEGLRMVSSPKRSCRRSYQSFQTSIVPYRTYGYNYSQVCGRITAYQYGITDGLSPMNSPNGLERSWTIDQRFLDGIVVSHGEPGSRKHIWSFVAASRESGNGINSCPCINSRSDVVRNLSSGIIGYDYFCDTGIRNSPRDNEFYSDNPLWDGQGCGGFNSCCEFNSPPWFCRQLPAPTNEDIEVRMVATATHANLEGEDTPIEKIDIFIR